VKLNDYLLIFVAVGLVCVLLIASPAIVSLVRLPSGEEYSELSFGVRKTWLTTTRSILRQARTIRFTLTWKMTWAPRFTTSYSKVQQSD